MFWICAEVPQEGPAVGRCSTVVYVRGAGEYKWNTEIKTCMCRGELYE